MERVGLRQIGSWMANILPRLLTASDGVRRWLPFRMAYLAARKRRLRTELLAIDMLCVAEYDFSNNNGRRYERQKAIWRNAT